MLVAETGSVHNVVIDGVAAGPWRFVDCCRPAKLLPTGVGKFIGVALDIPKYDVISDVAAGFDRGPALAVEGDGLCGTPVIARPRGSVTEIIENGVSGFLVENDLEAVEAILRLGTLDRRRIRDVFERRFTVRRMAEEYVRIYRRLVQGDRAGARYQLATPRS